MKDKISEDEVIQAFDQSSVTIGNASVSTIGVIQRNLKQKHSYTYISSVLENLTNKKILKKVKLGQASLYCFIYNDNDNLQDKSKK